MSSAQNLYTNSGVPTGSPEHTYKKLMDAQNKIFFFFFEIIMNMVTPQVKSEDRKCFEALFGDPR